MSQHPDHTAQIPKLNRALGQLEAVKRMLDEQRYCVDIITQLKAARSALKTVELAVLERHMQSCLQKAGTGEQQRNEQISEIIKLLKKYE